MKTPLVLLGTLGGAAALIVAMLEPLPGSVDLRQAVAAHMSASGVEHPVTAVLLNFRGYDTLLEVAVLLLAAIVILASGAVAAGTLTSAGEPLTQALARTVMPLMVMTAVYLLWAGAFRPGGAFQAAAVLAAGAVLLHLAGLLPAWTTPSRRARWGWVAGFAIFLAVAIGALGQGALLQYPPAQAGVLILLIESGLTISLGLVLAALFLLLSRERKAHD